MYDHRKLFCVVIVFYLLDTSLSIRVQRLPDPPDCDKSNTMFLREGNFGQSEHFSWLGLLRVSLNEGDVNETAVTGLVLVKRGFAIANANDINQLPIQKFMHNSIAMFIPTKGVPWLSTPTDYLIHSEYGVTTRTSLALIELDFEQSSQAQLKPICWPDGDIDTSKPLYALGFTDENTVIEKMFHSTKYIKPSLCTEFYRNITDTKIAPTRVLCRLAANNKNDCFWANGMALVSNATGHWTLIGFGIIGMGCAAPARFLNTNIYLPWIQAAIDSKKYNNLTQFQDAGNYRKTDPLEDYRTLFGLNWHVDTLLPHVFRVPYPIGQSVKADGSYKPYEIYEITSKKYQWVLKEKLRKGEAVSLDVRNNWACHNPKILYYREKMKVVEDFKRKSLAQYRITLFDRLMHNYTCLKIQIENGKLDINDSYVWFDDKIGREGEGFKDDGEDTPSELLKYYQVPQNYERDDVNPNFPYKWKGKVKHLEPKFIVDKANYEIPMADKNVNLLVGFYFKGEASMEIFLYGVPKLRRIRPTTTTRPPTTSLTTKHSTVSTTPKYWKRAHTFNEVPYKPKGKSRLEKAKQRYAERKAIARKTIASKAKERKTTNKMTKIIVQDRQRKANKTGAERNAVATTTESRNMFNNFPDVSYPF